MLVLAVDLDLLSQLEVRLEAAAWPHGAQHVQDLSAVGALLLLLNSIHKPTLNLFRISVHVFCHPLQLLLLCSHIPVATSACRQILCESRELARCGSRVS